MVDKNTRGNRILDIFLTNRPTLIGRCEILPGISDHEAVLTVAEVKARYQKPVAREIRLWDKGNLDQVKRDLLNFSQAFVSENTVTTPVNKLWDAIVDNINITVEKNIPTKTTSTRFSQPWINREIKRISRRKKRAFRQARKSGKANDWARYKRLKRESQAQCRQVHDAYVANLLSDDPSNNPKRFYSYIKSKRCDNSGVAPLRKEGRTHADPKTKAEILNNQFSSVFTREDTDSLPSMPHSPYADAPNITIEPNGVANLLAKLNPHKAKGPDNIEAKLLRVAAVELAPAISLLFQASLDQGVVPEIWKKAFVSPIFKKGDKATAANYRPISLTCILCKTLEHIIHSQVMKHLDRHNILVDSQHGFRRKRSCESQLIRTINDISERMNDKTQADAILLDFSKAFDKVPKKRLLLKLDHYGVRGKTLAWVDAFLSNRSQSVVVDGVSSNSAPVLSGVPQGSVLGPLLFLVYINDLPECVSSDTGLFADDTLLHRPVSSPDDAVALQADLTSLEDWEEKWNMDFNPSKCEVLHITNKRNPVNSEYHLHGVKLGVTKGGKYLGVTISPKLTWTKHIDKAVKKANGSRAFLQRNLRKCPRNIKELGYKTLVRPIIEYASTVWDPHTITTIKKIEMVQRRAARFVCSNFNRRCSVTAMLQSLGWATLERRRKEAKATMMYRIVHGLIAIPAEAYLQPAVRSAHRHIQPATRINCYKHSFFPSAVRVWNGIPGIVALSSTIDSFKAAVGTLGLGRA